jgi:asparagine synthase (glutamine-hydrolysing)
MGFRLQIRHALENAVHDRLDNTDRDIGFLLSGGLDSSLIASIASRKVGKDSNFLYRPRRKSGSRSRAKSCGVSRYTEHTEVKFTVAEGICTH